jgi:hypothetical protein
VAVLGAIEVLEDWLQVNAADLNRITVLIEDSSELVFTVSTL